MEVLRRSLKSIGSSLIFFVTYDVYNDEHKKLAEEKRLADIEAKLKDLDSKVGIKG